MSCDVKTYSRSASNPNSATASRDFAMNGTSTSAPGLVTSSPQHSTVNCRPTSRRRRDNPSPAGNPASSGTAGGRARRIRCRRARGGPARHADQHHRQPGRLLDGYDHRGRLPQPAAHRRPRLRPAVGVLALLETFSVAQELTASGIDRDPAEVIANATGKLAEQGDQRHGRPAEARSRRGPRPAADGNCRYSHRDRQPGNQAHPQRDGAVKKPARARLVHPGQHPLDVLAGDGAACFRPRMAGTAPSMPAGITRRVARKRRNGGAAVTGLRRADRPSRLDRVYPNATILGTVSRNQPGVGVPAHSARRAAALRPCIRRVPTTNPAVASLQALIMTGRNVQFLTAVNVLSH